MAKVVGPLHSSEARGSVSSLTYNTWRGISTVKARAGPTTQYSADQVALRAKAAIATAAWKAMTDAQRSLWNHYADSHPDIDWTGNPQRLSGYNWFIRINVRRQLIALGTTTAIPTEPVTYTIADLALESLPPILQFTWTALPWLPEWEQYLEFYITAPLSAGRHPNLPESDRKGAQLETMGSWQWSTVGSGWYTAFVRPLSNQGLVGSFRRLHVQVV